MRLAFERSYVNVTSRLGSLSVSELSERVACGPSAVSACLEPATPRATSLCASASIEPPKRERKDANGPCGSVSLPVAPPAAAAAAAAGGAARSPSPSAVAAREVAAEEAVAARAVAGTKGSGHSGSEPAAAAAAAPASLRNQRRP